MKADLGRLVRFNQQRAGNPELAIAHERGWRDYQTIKSFIYSERCRRRSVLDHFGDSQAGAPAGALLRRLRPAGLAARSRDDRDPPQAERQEDRGPADRPLRRRRAALRAAEGLAPTAPPTASRPSPSPTTRPWKQSRPPARPTDDALLAIRGIGPSFVSKYAAEVLDSSPATRPPGTVNSTRAKRRRGRSWPAPPVRRA